MEPNNDSSSGSQVEQKSVLHQVTPLSKYLAMALFIILPFVGAYVGYTLAPLKVVEVEKIIEVEKLAVGEGQVSEIGIDDLEASFDTKTTQQRDFAALQALFKNQLNQDEEIQFLYSPQHSNLQYFKILYRSSKSSGIVVYDPATNNFSRTAFQIDSVVGESASPDGRFISKLVDYSSPTTTIEIIDLESESVIRVIEPSEDETLWSGKCGYAGPTFDMEWIGSSTIKYGVYNLNSVDSEGCDTVFVEYRTESF